MCDIRNLTVAELTSQKHSATCCNNSDHPDIILVISFFKTLFKGKNFAVE